VYWQRCLVVDITGATLFLSNPIYWLGDKNVPAFATRLFNQIGHVDVCWSSVSFALAVINTALPALPIFTRRWSEKSSDGSGFDTCSRDIWSSGYYVRGDRYDEFRVKNASRLTRQCVFNEKRRIEHRWLRKLDARHWACSLTDLRKMAQKWWLPSTMFTFSRSRWWPHVFFHLRMHSILRSGLVNGMNLAPASSQFGLPNVWLHARFHHRWFSFATLKIRTGQ